MAKETIVLDIQTDGSKAEGSVKSLKAQLREAQAEVGKMADKFGETSAQAIEAAKRAADLKDRIGDAKALTDAFNPDRKFQAFSSAIQGVTGGFAALQGAQALFGAESEDLQKVLVKVQAAMALSQGINSVMEAKDAFKVLGAVIKTNVVGAFNSMKAALISTGIGALVIGLGLLIDKLMSMSDAAEKAAEAQKKLNEETKKYADEGLKSELRTLDRLQKVELSRLKARGASEQEIFDLEQDFRKRKGESQIRYYEQVKKIDANAANEAKAAINDINAEGQAAAYANEERLRKIQEDAAKKRKDERDKEAQEIKDANKKANDDILKLQQENTLARISDEQKRAEAKLEFDLENSKKDIENSKASASLKAKEIQALEEKYILDLRSLQDKNAEENKKKKEEQDKKDAEDRKKKLEEELKSEKETFDIVTQARLSQIKDAGVKRQEEEAIRYQNEIDNLFNALNNREISEADFNARREALKTLHEQKLTDIEKTNADERAKIAEAEAQTKIAQFNAVGNAMNQLSEIVGKQTAVGKALGIAQATINTYLGATEVLRAKSVLPEPAGTIAKLVNVAAIIATGIKSVKAIVSTKVPGGGSGGGSMPSISATAPIAPQMSSTALNQQLINQTGNATTRAFVLESDVSGNQERIRRLNRAARIN